MDHQNDIKSIDHQFYRIYNCIEYYGILFNNFNIITSEKIYFYTSQFNYKKCNNLYLKNVSGE